MKRNQRKSAVEVKDLREQMGHLEATLGGMTGLHSAADDVAGAVTMLRQVRATEEDPKQIVRAEQARADATEVFSMAHVTATMVWLERTSWEQGQAHRATLAQGQRLNRATWVLAVSTGVLTLATLGLIWATFTA
jgi:hypothetical protein